MKIKERCGCSVVGALEKLGEYEYEIIGEVREIDSLGLADYGPKADYCTFLSSDKYLGDLLPNAKVVITNSEIADAIIRMGKTAIVVDNPTIVFFRLHNYLARKRKKPIVTVIGKSTKIADSAIIAPNDVVVGENSIIEENVEILPNTVIGNNVVIRSGSIIGGQEFEYKREGQEIFHVEHIGKTLIGDGVEIGYGCVIGKAIYPWDSTIINEQTKVADNVVVGHGAKIAKRSMIGAGTVICGRTIIDDDVWIGPNSSISNALHIGKTAHVGIGSVVISDVPEGKNVFGNPARTMLGR